MPSAKDFHSDKANGLFAALYGHAAAKTAPARLETLEAEFFRRFGAGDCRLFSAPGRIEIGGNHTDHNGGRVLAAAISLDTVAAVRPNGTDTVRLISDGYRGEFAVDLKGREAVESEKGTTRSLIRGVASRMAELGYMVGGFDACVTSTVLKGSGLSSSAAFEVLVAAVFDGLFNVSQMDAKLRAQVAQHAENVFFGKPSGLMDQMASSVGGLVAIDFADTANPAVHQVRFDFGKMGYRIAVVDTGGSHANLTHEYAAIPGEMYSVAKLLGVSRLGDAKPAEFDRQLAALRGKVPDRALLRAMHFYGDDARVPLEVAALEAGDMEAFFQLVIDSGESSWKLLQNCVSSCSPEQGVALALAMSERILRGRGAWRVHGGGFAGTVLAFVREGTAEDYRAQMEAVFGAGACTFLAIRQDGAVELIL